MDLFDSRRWEENCLAVRVRLLDSEQRNENPLDLSRLARAGKEIVEGLQQEVVEQLLHVETLEDVNDVALELNR